MIYSKQKVFCNCCGKQLEIEFISLIGRNFKCCSMECLKEMNWRETLSILGRPYEIDPNVKFELEDQYPSQ